MSTPRSKKIKDERDRRLCRPNATMVRWEGETISLALLLFRLGRLPQLRRVRERLRQGWTVEDAVRRRRRPGRSSANHRPPPDLIARKRYQEEWRAAHPEAVRRIAREGSAHYRGLPGTPRRAVTDAAAHRLYLERFGEPDSEKRAHYLQARRDRYWRQKVDRVLGEVHGREAQDRRHRESLRRFIRGEAA